LPIEKNIPIPTNIATGGYGQPPKYPEFALMEVGDSVSFVHNEIAIKAACSAHNLHRTRAEHRGKKFIKRGNRIWRIA
jgi:hypothetical protein